MPVVLASGIYFRMLGARGAVKSLGPLDRGPVAKRAKTAAKFAKTFFFSIATGRVEKIAAKFRVGGGRRWLGHR
jgi:hypothetical protein